ncbi:MAG: hypothetical protein Q4B28_06970 [bacterium]|nr:hypothetical protein [bacterium]
MQKSEKSCNWLDDSYNFDVNIKLLGIDSLLVERAVAIMKKTLPKKIGRKKRVRLNSGQTETSIFSYIREKNKGKSELTGRFCEKENLRSWQFAHILCKKNYPKLRLNPENIIFVDNKAQHDWVDKQTNGRKAEFEEMVAL